MYTDLLHSIQSKRLKLFIESINYKSDNHFKWSENYLNLNVYFSINEWKFT